MEILYVANEILLTCRLFSRKLNAKKLDAPSPLSVPSKIWTRVKMINFWFTIIYFRFIPFRFLPLCFVWVSLYFLQTLANFFVSRTWRACSLWLNGECKGLKRNRRPAFRSAFSNDRCFSSRNAGQGDSKLSRQDLLADDNARNTCTVRYEYSRIGD